MGSKNNHRRSPCCCFTLTALIISMSLLLLLLAYKELKPKNPTTTVVSAKVTHLRFAVEPLPIPHVRLNLTLLAMVTVENPNPVGFKYSGEGKAYLRYRGSEVGSAQIPAGEIAGNGEKKMNLTMTVMLDRLLGDSRLYSDVVSGYVPLRTHIRLPGKVRILVVGVRVVTYAACDMVVDLRGRNIDRQTCQYSTKVG